MRIPRPLPVLACLALLTACEPVGHMDMGGGELRPYALEFHEWAAFLFVSLATAALLVQAFLAPLRRLFAAGFRRLLRRCGHTQQLAESARLFATATAWFGFCCGVSLLPLCLMLHENTFFFDTAGPGNLGLLPGIFLALFLSVCSFIITCLWLRARWQQLHTPPMTNPIARTLASRGKAAVKCLLPACLLLLLLPACKPSVKSLRNIEINDHHFGTSEDEVDMDAEARRLVEHYLATGDVNYATPEHGITMLHLAAATHRLWLTRQLLAEGANPKARLKHHFNGKERPGDTPAQLAIRAAGSGEANTDSLFIIKALLEKGADLNAPGLFDCNILSHCEENSYWRRPKDYHTKGEDLALELMRLGAKGDANVAINFIRHGWTKALGTLLQSPEAAEILPHMRRLLHASALAFEADEGELECLSVLLRHASAEEVRGSAENNPLFTLARDLPEQYEDRPHAGASEEERARYADYITQLLNHGADLYAPAGTYGMSCAADYIVIRPWMLQELQKRGIKVEAPAHVFTQEKLVEQLLDTPTDAVRTQEVQAQFELIASVLNMPLPDEPTPVEEEACRRYDADEAALYRISRHRDARTKALSLLYRADANRTRAMLMQLPAWQDASAWAKDSPALQTSRLLLAALQNTPEVVLPADFLIQSARQMEQAGQPGVAHAFTRLLSRNKGADALVEQLCAEGTPLPLRAAAWSCKLSRMGEKREELPGLGRMREWLREEHYIYNTDDFPILKDALEADRIAYSVRESELPPMEQLLYERNEAESGLKGHDEYARRNVQEALQRIGAPLAAQFCGAAAPGELSPELAALRDRYGLPLAASLEHELALSLYIWQNREVFLHPREHRHEAAAPAARTIVK